MNYDPLKTAAKAAWGWLAGAAVVILEASLSAIASPDTIGQVLTARSWRLALVPFVTASVPALKNYLKHKDE